MTYRLVTLGFVCFLIHLHVFSQSAQERGLQVINQNSLQGQLTFFSSDWFEGREATTKGAYMASDYLASLFHVAGIPPLGEDSSFFQQVPLIIYEESKKGQLTLTQEGCSYSFQAHQDYLPPIFPRSIELEGPLLWGGFGLKEKSLNEFSTKNSTGKIMVRLKGLPKTKNSSAYVNGLKQRTDRELTVLKNNMAKEAGVVAILEYDPENPFLTNNSHQSLSTNAKATAEQGLTKRSSGIYKKQYQLAYSTPKEIPVFKISQSIIQTLIPDFEQQLAKYTNGIKKGKVQPISTPIESAHLSIKAQSEYKTCRNVLAKIEGSEYPDEIIVIGAHYDHLGTYDGYIWNGADDNGSGAIGVTTIAKAFKATGIQPKRTVIFALWTAEERGLLGSQYFVDQFEDIEKVKYYHNYDMIGRSYTPSKPDSAVSLLYTETWKEAEELTNKLNTDYKLGLKINFSPWNNPVGGSDNAHFARKGIPIMWFHTGGHPDYHMPGDHVDKIDWSKLEGIVKTSFLTLWELANE